MIAAFMTDAEIHLELGSRLRSRRLSNNMTIDEMARHSGVNSKTIASLELGGDVRFSSVIKYLRSLGMIDSLDVAIPDLLPSRSAFTIRAPLELRVRASGGSRKKF